MKINHRKDKANANTKIYLGSVFVTYIQYLSHPLEIFLYPLTLYTQNQHLAHHLTNSLCQICTTLLITKKTTTPYTNSLQPETLLYNAPLWVITIDAISLESVCVVDKGSYRWTLKNLHYRVGIWMKNWKWKQFSEKQIFQQSFWAENYWFWIGIFSLGQHTYL